ncbi:MAG: hypothetical protein H6719_06355 [Sandaracinaceae bacterium]|nr:hypothetical protein [Sandaracinaceae bacterium]
MPGTVWEVRLRAVVLITVIATLSLGCDPDDPMVDAGPPPTDAGTDAGEDAGYDAGVDAGAPCDGPPDLYIDPECTIVGPGIRAYTPRFELWADGATKERWIYLPEGTQIDTADPDHWVYPVGTRLYKTFSLGGMRLETRILEKTSAGVGVASWTPSVYAWNAEGTAVTDVTNAAPAVRENVLGTDHDIPDGALCLRCHIGQNGHDMINGFTAFQLNHDDAGVNYQTLLDEGRIANPFSRSDAVVPGDATAVAALGYLHTNCGYCHRPGGDPAAALRMFYMRLEVGASATVEDTTTYRTGVNNVSSITFGSALCRYMPGDSTNSVAIHRASSRMAGVQMPPVATEMVHEAGIATLRAWIDGLTVAPAAECTPSP